MKDALKPFANQDGIKIAECLWWSLPICMFRESPLASLANRLLEKEKKSFSRSSKVQQRGELETLVLSFYSWFPKSSGVLISDLEVHFFLCSVCSSFADQLLWFHAGNTGSCALGGQKTLWTNLVSSFSLLTRMLHFCPRLSESIRGKFLSSSKHLMQFSSLSFTDSQLTIQLSSVLFLERKTYIQAAYWEGWRQKVKWEGTGPFLM